MSFRPNRTDRRPRSAHVYCNDNIRTGHLKCDHCRTRTALTGIKQSDGVEIRSFGCPHCGLQKSVRIASGEAMPARSFACSDY